jgi:hypothetical protein
VCTFALAHCTQGEVYERLDNTARAVRCCEWALRMDVQHQVSLRGVV